MNLPKDWSKKPDWLDKAKEPSEGGFSVFLLFAAGCGLLACAVALFVSIFFL